MSKFLQINIVRHYKCSWIENKEIFIRPETIQAILPWDVEGQGDGYCLIVQSYGELLEPYLIKKDQYDKIILALGNPF